MLYIVVCRKACSCGSQEILKDNKVLHKKVICKYKPIIAKITHKLFIVSQKVLQFMKKYTKVKVLRISETQHKTLVKMKEYCPFSNNTILLKK